jgi:phage/plasmid-like protein (TIGR03299 family)
MNDMTAATISVNEQFAAGKAGQIDMARAAAAANAQALADYDSGAAQAQLDATLAQQLADGKIEMIGTDQYRALEGWDRNEIFRVQRATRPGELVLVLPETGLDKAADGTRELLYTAVPTWHNAEGVGLIPGGTTDIQTVLEAGGLDYEIDQRAVRYYAGGELRTMPGKVVNTRTDTFAALGVVSKGFGLMQPRESMGFLQELAGRHDIPFESAGPLDGGKKIFVSMKLPEGIIIDPEGINERNELFLAIMDAFDTSASYQAIVSPWRPICRNTNRFALRDALARWRTRHTKGIKDRAAEAQRTLGLTVKYAGSYAKEETRLAQTDIMLAEVDKLLAELWPAEENATDKQKAAAKLRLDQVFARFELEAARVGQTAYAAENAVTGYLDHDRPRRAAPVNLAAAIATQVLVGTDDETKTRAHKKLMTLVNR